MTAVIKRPLDLPITDEQLAQASLDSLKGLTKVASWKPYIVQFIELNKATIDAEVNSKAIEALAIARKNGNFEVAGRSLEWAIVALTAKTKLLSTGFGSGNNEAVHININALAKACMEVVALVEKGLALETEDFKFYVRTLPQPLTPMRDFVENILATA
jgi:hypothetical protein